jgi:ceramide synthetase
MKLSPLKDKKDAVIESGMQSPYRMSQIIYKHNSIDKSKLSEQVVAFCRQSGRKKEEVDSYIWDRRRLVQQKRKIIKYVEALWRFFFYAAFCIMGVYTLFLPEPVSWMPWMGDTKQFWDGWPLKHVISDGIRLYYQVELGSYLHQLMWTEVSRSDAMEMIVHHLTTILLIGLSYVTNYTRVGVTIMLLHDMADVFLESAKVFNYSSKPRGHEWAKVVCDGLFATFAFTFFVTRLIVYPAYVIRSVLFEAPTFFGVNWLGFWLFASLLVVLQGLHIFWFYLIARMLYRLFTTGIEKDERSDDEDDMEYDNQQGSGGGGGGVGGGDETSRTRTRSYELSSGKISGVTSPGRKNKQS